MKLALRPLTAATLAASAALAVSLAACGSSTSETTTRGPAESAARGADAGNARGRDTLAAVKVERMIVAQFEEQGISLRDVRCEKVVAQAGSPVRCTGLNPSGTKLFIEGTFTSRTGNKGHLEVKAVRGEAAGTVFAEQIVPKVEEQAGVQVEDLSCPKTIEMPTTSPVRCVATVAGGDRHEITLSVDAEGQSSIEYDTEPLS